ncbi:MAG: glycosyltransferase [Patescibacteria group bacterium]|nr:glycosyltransferase [Patescibacteria group bacterium]
MKILYIAMKYDYGDLTRGFGFEHYNFYDSLVKMNDSRYQIIYFPFDEIISKKGRQEMNRELLETVWREKPNLCFFFLFTDEIKKEVIKEISEKSGSITFNWFADDHWRFDIFSKYWAPLFHWISTTDSRAPEKYKKIGYENVIKTQWACNQFLYKPPANFNFEKPEYKYDVTFIGQPHGNRKRIVNYVKGAGTDIQCWGNGWPNGRILQEKMIEVFNTSKINLNFTKSSGRFLSIKEIAKIFLNRRADGSLYLRHPLSWYDNLKSLWHKQREMIKGRNFEIPGCGGFFLTTNADNLQDYYEDGKEMVLFKDANDLIDKIKYYLGNEEKIKRIAKAGYRRTLKDHTYEWRFNEIFKKIGLIK